MKHISGETIAELKVLKEDLSYNLEVFKKERAENASLKSDFVNTARMVRDCNLSQKDDIKELRRDFVGLKDYNRYKRKYSRDSREKKINSSS